MELVSLGPLDAFLLPPPDGQPVTLTVVLLHGFGAPGTDLVGLAREIDAPAGTRFVFLQGPLLLDPSAPPAWAGRAWWHIDMLELQVLRATGQHEELARRTPAGLDEARAQLGAALDALEKDYGAPPERLVLGGFSQGAMLTTDFTLRAARPPAGLVILSGTIIAEDEWRGLFPGRRGLPIFQSHSPDDQVLPFALAEKLAGFLREAGAKSEFVSFRGGHGIGPSVLAGLGRFLRSL